MNETTSPRRERRLLKVCRGDSREWRKWIGRAGALWVYGSGDRRRKATGPEVEAFIRRHGHSAVVAFYPMFNHLTVEIG